MDKFFIFLFRLFRRRNILFPAVIIVILLLTAFLASRTELEEDISKSVPGANNQTAHILNNSRYTNKIILNIFKPDTLAAADPGLLIAFAGELTDSLSAGGFSGFISNSGFRIDESKMGEMVNFFCENLPVFLNESDLAGISSKLSREAVDRTMERNYQTLNSPAGFISKNSILTDPVGLGSPVFTKLKQFQVEDGYEIIDGYIFTRGRSNLLLFIDPVNPPSETLQNALFLKKLTLLLEHLKSKNNYKINAEFYGAAAVAVGNAEQIKRDIALTVTIALLIILIFVGWFSKSKVFPFISFLPSVFGGGAALALIFIIKGKMSTISLGIGSVLLGIIVDYALYIYGLYKTRGSMETVIRDMTSSIFICSLTSAIAFFSLLFLKSEVLRDLGLFAGLSILGAAFVTLAFLPYLIAGKGTSASKQRITFIDRIADYKFESDKLLIVAIIIITVVFFFTYRKAGFETDMYSMNYLSPRLQEAEKNLNRVSNLSLKSIFVFSTGKNLEEALKTNTGISVMLGKLRDQGLVSKYTDVGSVLINDSIQRERIKRWNEFWSGGKKEEVIKLIRAAGGKYGFKNDAFTGFYSLISKDYKPFNLDRFGALRNLFLNDMITETGDQAMVMSLVKVDSEHRHKVFTAFSGIENCIVIDRLEMTSDFVKGIKDDFDLLVSLCMIFVTLTLIIAFGRIELGFITSVPMMLSWLWTLGFMGLTGLKFNIINIIVSTFVFGLGVDYSILMTKGYLMDYKYGHKDLASYKTSIFLSSFTTIVGVGVLLLAKHPSLNSIALISVVGLVSVVIISYTLEPILFSWFVSKKGKKRFLPVTFSDIISTVFILTIGLVMCIVLNLMFFFVVILPLSGRKKRRIMHTLLFLFIKAASYGLVTIKYRILNEGEVNFGKPSLIVANHQSHLDLPLLLMLDPRIIILTTDWVWNNPLYALVIRYLHFYPVTWGYEVLAGKLRKEIEEGYSILVFPEGTRSPDSRIQRFHKGAFLLAEKLDLDITPVLIHGAGDCMNKGENHIRSGNITVKIYPGVNSDDNSRGADYHERTKSFLRFYRDEYQKVKSEIEVPSYFRKKLIMNYIYKGPVLEWYTRVKLRLENNYSYINDCVPAEADIVDIGCGYGLISYMLCFTSEKRNILGIDYDKEKVDIANTCISRNDRINFIEADAVDFDYPGADVFIMSDVLHYMPAENREILFDKCFEKLRPGGIIIIRDADKDLQKRHLGTRYTEFFSTRFGYNKATGGKLYFFSGRDIREMAVRKGMQLEVIDKTRLTSNMLYILRKPASEKDTVRT